MTERLQTVQQSSAQLDTLLHGCGIYVSDSAKLAISGEDRVRWTNGMVTNNVRDLPVNRGNQSFVLNAQGRVQGDITVYNRGEILLAETSRAQTEKLSSIFDRYIIMDDVEITDISDKLASVVAVGPQAQSVLETCGFPASHVERGEAKDLDWQGFGCTLVCTPEDRAEQFEIWMSRENVSKVIEALVAAGATVVDTEAIEVHRIVRGIPVYGIDIAERDLPQETAQDHVLHYSKGCYIGQEIVERIHSRGNVHRTFTGFEVAGPAPERGSKVVFNDKEVGEITSSTVVHLNGAERTLALGYVRREASAPGTEVKISDTNAKVTKLPFAIS